MISSRKRVLFLIPSLSVGGAERVFSVLLRHLDRERFELHLAVLQSQGPLAQEIPADVVIHDLKATRVRYAVPALVKLIWKLRPDIVLSTLGHLNLALIAAKSLMPRGIRLFVRETTVVSTYLRENISYPRLWRWLYRSLYKRAAGIVCPSNAVMEDLIVDFGIPKEKLVRIYNPVDINSVCAMAESAGNPYSGSKPRLVTVGRLSREKGLDVLLDAMPVILQALPDAQLTILGDGPQLADLLAQSRRLGLTERVHFVGFQKNPWQYMRYADLFILPSRFEGLPNALLEALALGVRVIATDCVGGTREVQAYNPQMVLVPPEDPAALAHSVITIYRMPSGRSNTEEAMPLLRSFGLQETVDAYSRALEQI